MRLMNYEGKFPGAVNLGNPVELSVGDLAARVLSMTGSKSRIVTRPLPVDDPRRRRPDITRAEQLLNWAPSTSLDAGLRETIKWFSGELERETRPVRTPISVRAPVPASPA
jgi:UDP-glucuronate decarboxylase